MDNCKLRSAFVIYSSLEDAMKLKLHQSIHFEMRFCMYGNRNQNFPFWSKTVDYNYNSQGF